MHLDHMLGEWKLGGREGGRRVGLPQDLLRRGRHASLIMYITHFYSFLNPQTYTHDPLSPDTFGLVIDNEALVEHISLFPLIFCASERYR